MPSDANPKKFQEQPFWSYEPSKVMEILETDIQKGLTIEEAENRLRKFGENIIEKSKITPGFFIFLNQFRSPLIVLLSFAGIVTIFIGHYRDALFILAAVAVNTALGFYQEYKAEKAISELRK